MVEGGEKERNEGGGRGVTETGQPTGKGGDGVLPNYQPGSTHG